MREIEFRETSADTERIKCNTNGMKTGSSKKIVLLKVKTAHLNPVEQQDSAILLLMSSKLLLKMHETDNC